MQFLGDMRKMLLLRPKRTTYNDTNSMNAPFSDYTLVPIIMIIKKYDYLLPNCLYFKSIRKYSWLSLSAIYSIIPKPKYKQMYKILHHREIIVENEVELQFRSGWNIYIWTSFLRKLRKAFDSLFILYFPYLYCRFFSTLQTVIYITSDENSIFVMNLIRSRDDQCKF